MKRALPGSCPRCHRKKSFGLAKSRGPVERLILPWRRIKPLRCRHCGYRLHIRLGRDDLESLGRRDRHAAAVSSPQRPSNELPSEFDNLIRAIHRREKMLSQSDEQTDTSESEGVAG